MQEATGEPAVLWGTAIIGFESRHYRYAAGIGDDIAAVSFSPRKARTLQGAIVIAAPGTPSSPPRR